MQEYQKGTQCLHAGYVPESGEPRNIPIVQSTTFRYGSSEAMGALFDLEAEGYFYTRLRTPPQTGWPRRSVPWRGARRRC